MIEQIPEQIINVQKKFKDQGYKIYLVGGSVRNLLLQKPVKDWDFTTSATPEQILELFPDGFYDNQYGTVGIPFEVTRDNKQVMEITTFRTEQEYKDHRHPTSVQWGKTIEEDLSRRDFTMNAIALDLKDDLSYDLIDPFNGQQDLEKGIVKAVGDAEQRFAEDALRLMRAIRFATQLGFTLEKETWDAVVKNASLIQEIANERIREELMRIMASDHPFEGVMLLKNSGLLQYILPELLEGVDVSQKRPGRHHIHDVFTHNVFSLKFCPSIDPLVRFATLIHDVGKPRVASKDEDGFVIFYNHEIVGAKMASEITDRLRFSKKEKQKIVTLIRWHMFTVDEHITDSAVRRFIRRVGVDNVADMMDLRIGDRLGGGTQTAESWRLKLFKKRVEEQLAPAPFSINDLVVDGTDVMKELAIKPSKRVGEILQKLFEEVDEDLEKNNREYLLKRMKDYGQE